MTEVAKRVLKASRLRELPIFPLPNAVLLPQGYLPLHVFEPRYRSMVDDCLTGDGVMAVALLGASAPASAALSRRGPPVRPIAGAGVVEVHERLPDDRRLIVLRGVHRVRLLDEVQVDRLYRVMRAEPVPCVEEPSAALRDSVQVLLRLVRDLVENTPDDGAQPLLEACHSEQRAGRLADLVAATVTGDTRARQRVLEEVDVGRRIDHVCRELAALLAGLKPEDERRAN